MALGQSKPKLAKGSIVAPCSCQSQQQDRLHGQGYRVKNLTQKQTARCTVCGKEEKE